MKLLKILFLFVLAASSSLQAESKTPDGENVIKATQKNLYVFGISQDLSDSTIFVSPIAPLNGAGMLAHNMLENRQYYSVQLKEYVEKQFNTVHQTAAFFYFTNKKKAEKKFLKTKNAMEKRAVGKLCWNEIPYEDFHFKVPVIVSDADTDEETETK